MIFIKVELHYVPQCCEEMLKKGTKTIKMTWLRYQRVISLETQVGITSRRNKWVNTDPRIYVGGVSIPISTCHTHREPSSIIMNAELSAVEVSVSSTV
jgi:hypothetical protein